MIIYYSPSLLDNPPKGMLFESEIHFLNQRFISVAEPLDLKAQQHATMTVLCSYIVIQL